VAARSLISAREEEIIEVLLKIASYQCHVDKVRKWLEKNTERQ